MHYFEPVDTETLRQIWKIHNKTLDDVKQDVETLRNWLYSQPHLPHTLTYNQLQTFLLMNRGSIERPKLKIDMYYSMRTFFPDVFQSSNPFSERMLQALKCIVYVPLPKMCADFSRITIVKIKDVDSQDIDPYAWVAHFMNVVELRLIEEKCNGHMAIIDLEHFNINHLVKLTPMFYKYLYTIGTKVLTIKISAIHIINAPSFIDQVLMIAKAVINPKLANAIIVHKDIASMLESIDQSILPKEYGGNEKSLDELEELLYKKLEEHRELFEQLDQVKVNEDLRPAKNINDEVLGYYGNFRQLNVD